MKTANIEKKTPFGDLFNSNGYINPNFNTHEEAVKKTEEVFQRTLASIGESVPKIIPVSYRVFENGKWQKRVGLSIEKLGPLHLNTPPLTPVDEISKKSDR